MLKLDRALIVLDLEATGLDPVKDRIVEIGIVKITPDGFRKDWTQRFDPEIPIPAEATEVHGISDADVAECPTFRDMARLIHAGLLGADIAGYNLYGLDLPMLSEEFHRAGVTWEWKKHRIIDAAIIFKRREERTLSAAMKFYCAKEHTDAHGALADAAATYDVLLGQIAHYADLNDASIDELVKAGNYEKERLDLAGWLVKDKDGDAVFTRGKAKGRKLCDDIGFADWMLRQSFVAEDTARAVREEIQRLNSGVSKQP